MSPIRCFAAALVVLTLAATGASAADPSVTIHVYCGEMTWYNAFYPAQDVWRHERRETYYTS